MKWETREQVNVTVEANVTECHNETVSHLNGSIVSNSTYEVCNQTLKNITQEETVLKVAGRFRAFDGLNLLIIHHAGRMVARDQGEVVLHMLKEFIENNGHLVSKSMDD